MAHLLLRSYPTNTTRKLCTKPSCSYYYNTLLKRSTSERVNWVVLTKGSSHFGYKGRVFLAQSYSSTSSNRNSSSVSEGVQLVGNSAGFDAVNGGERDNGFEYLANGFGWKVRRLANNGEEIRNAATVQAEAFHEPSLLFDDFFFEFFQAEVLAGLIYKLRNSPSDRYACLVAEPETTDISNTNQNPLVGVVDVTVLRDQNVLQNLPPDAEEYLYISGIAVSASFRRKKIATVLLKACDALSVSWGFKYLVLRAYDEDFGARELYSNAGYRVVSADPPWLTTWIGRKRRVLMIKQSNLPPPYKES